MKRFAAVVAALTVVAPAAAAAQDPAAPAPAKVTASSFGLSIERAGRAKTVLTGQRVRVRGTIVPYVENQSVVVRFVRGGRTVGRKTVTLLPSKSGRSGYFLTGFTSRRAGRITVRAGHAGTAELDTTRAGARSFDVLPRRVGRGAKGTGVRMLQRKLDRLGYVVGRRGVFDGRTARAVMAFRKVTGMRRTFAATRAVMRKVAAGRGRFRVRFPSHGRHIEADISRQVLALIGAGGRVERIYHTSTGAPATPTIKGSYRVYRKSPGTNAKGMVHSSYFIRGYAIHGYKSVPTYNASHGCLRVPVPDALSIFRWVRMGTPVDTYR